ncbi:MAG: GntR family transcriptional regulator, partial [Albidovulum sp.]
MTRLSFKTTESRLRRLLAELAPDAGDRLPAERMLAMRLGCSRETLRKGLSTLEREGEIW